MLLSRKRDGNYGAGGGYFAGLGDAGTSGDPVAVGVGWQYTKVGVAVGITEQHELLVTMRADGKVESFEQRNKGG